MSRLHPSRTVRAVLWGCGALNVVLAILGILLPGLPATPFILLAGACFVRASPRAHAWLLNSRLFGPVLREWEQHHSIPRRVKWFALATMVAMSSVSLWFFAGNTWVQAGILLGVVIGAVAVCLVPTRQP